MTFPATKSLATLAIVAAAWAGGIVATPPASSTRPATTRALAKAADNSFCLPCHANYLKEPIALQHQTAGIGCAACHGDSETHSSDEDGLVPPQVMFAASAVMPACLKCHERARMAHVKEHGAVLSNDPGRTSCIDCHGQHKLKVRTRRWDKSTGKLLSDDGVRVLERPSGPG
jgi:hypothetical protein